MKIDNSGVRRVILGLIVISLPMSSGWCSALRAGAAKVEITPPNGIAMWGYSNRKGPATRTLDPLYARVLVLDVASRRLAFVSLDLGRPFGPASLKWLQSATRNDISHLIVAATHTHSGPVVQDDYPNGAPAWETAALQKIARAISDTCAHLTDAQIGTGYGFALIGHNRLRVNPDGTVSWFERNLTQMPTAPVDGTVSVLRIDTAAGQPMAILVNYACHPVVFGSDNLQYSADFPGVMEKTVEEAFDGKPLCFFLQGAPGDINPYLAVTPLEEDAIGARDRTGQVLGREAVRVAKQIHTQADEQPDLQVDEALVPVHLRWNPDKWKEALIAVFGPNAAQTFPSRVAEEVQLPVTTVLINKKIAILTMPGEPFVEYQIDWRQRCPVRDPFLVGYANGYNGYFPTIRSATLHGYGAANPATWVEVGAGDRMVDVGITSVYRMLGRMREMPEDLQK